MSDSPYTYQLTNTDMILRLPDNAWIPPDPANRDYQAYLDWCAAGNTPADAPPPPRPSPEELQTVQVADPENEADAVNLRTLNTQLEMLNQRIDTAEEIARRR